jgi:hypothetical protein
MPSYEERDYLTVKQIADNLGVFCLSTKDGYTYGLTTKYFCGRMCFLSHSTIL